MPPLRVSEPLKPILELPPMVRLVGLVPQTSELLRALLPVRVVVAPSVPPLNSSVAGPNEELLVAK